MPKGKISGREMVEKVARASALAGLSAFIITGLIVGLNILFPAFFPMLAPVLFIINIVSLIFLAYYAVRIAQGWWEVLKEHELLNGFVAVLENVEDFMREMIDETDDNILIVVWEWIEGLAERVGIDRAWQMAIGFVQRMGIGSAWNWFASQTQAVKNQATFLFSALNAWDFPDLDTEVEDIRKAIANVIDIEFREALVTADEIRRSMRDHFESAGLEAVEAS